MDDLPLSLLFTALMVLIVVSACFSGSETAMMSLNRYRLRHLVESRHRGAILASALLARPDRLIGLILLGNNFVNILASALATVIAMRLYGDAGIAIATALLTLVILIFAEVTPKTLAVLHPERLAFPAARVLTPLLKLLYPVVWLTNGITNGLLRLAGVAPQGSAMHQLSREELRVVVNEAGALIPRRHQQMLVSILDLEKVKVDDIMVPRNEIEGLDLNEDLDDIIRQLTTSQHTRLPLYRDSIDNVTGIIHVRTAMHLLAQDKLTRDTLATAAHEVYFVPEGTPLTTQLLNFQREKRRIAMVVDEYGDMLGLVTLEDILEEIVGEFTTDLSSSLREVHPQEDGSYLVDGAAHVRELNRLMHWELPETGPKTLSGLIIEYLETIPEPGTSLLIAGYPIEITHTSANTVKTARIYPNQRRPQEEQQKTTGPS
ncbi:MAG TPA: HlyC/CorC family transporter [Gammaproteobacteria bacterium]|nr:HlyC/CorC family transporter [Gammaproteobacteria bacterium]